MTKREVLHLGQGKPWDQPRLGNEQIQSSPVQKDLGVLVDSREPEHEKWWKLHP